VTLTPMARASQAQRALPAIAERSDRGTAARFVQWALASINAGDTSSSDANDQREARMNLRGSQPSRSRATQRAQRAALMMFLIAGATACMSNPRDRQTITDPKQFWIEGLLATPNTTVSVDTSPDGINWTPDYAASVNSSSKPTADPIGQNWYRYSKATYLGWPKYWSGDLATHTAKMRVRTYVRGSNHPDGPFDPNQDVVNASFDDDSPANGSRATAVQSCVRAHYNNGWADVINSCKAARTPVATVSTPCGASGQICCGTAGCDPGLRCTSNDVCGVCGASGQTPCQDVPSGNAYCNSGYNIGTDALCRVCGGNGQKPCWGNYCRVGYSVEYQAAGSNPNCQPCGALNQPACQQPNTAPTCNTGLRPNSFYKCVSASTVTNPPTQPAPPPPSSMSPVCGGAGNICCGGTSCNSGLYCSSGFCSPNPPGDCDYLGEACCFDGSTTNLSCSSVYDYQLKCNSGYCGH
jgi:hypothetical protein